MVSSLGGENKHHYVSCKTRGYCNQAKILAILSGLLRANYKLETSINWDYFEVGDITTINGEKNISQLQTLAFDGKSMTFC